MLCDLTRGTVVVHHIKPSEEVGMEYKEDKNHCGRTLSSNVFGIVQCISQIHVARQPQMSPLSAAMVCWAFREC
jgi:hypothetical protein